jgi:preprotein translocase subunit SecF
MLNDIALALFVGLTAGAYSSIFIAPPIVADLKERESQMRSLRKRVLAKRASEAAKADEPQTGTEPAEDVLDGDDLDDDEGAAATAGLVGQRTQGGAAAGRPARNQPPGRGNRSRNRPSGKRR